MPSIKCNCGNKIACGEIPSSVEWLAISDVEFDSYSGMVDVESLYMSMKRIVKCPSCRRLFVFWEGAEVEPSVYVLDPNTNNQK